LNCPSQRFTTWCEIAFLLFAMSFAISSTRLNAQTVSNTERPPITGPLTVSANSHYFKDPHGGALTLNGSQTWNTLQDWGFGGPPQPLDFNAFVSFLAAHGQNFTLLWTVEIPRACGLPTTEGASPDITISPLPYARTGPGNATDGGLKFDLTKFNQEFFDRLRARTKALNNAGIYAGVYLFTGEFLNIFRCSNDGYPLTQANNINGIDDGYSGSGKNGTGSISMTAPNAITKIQDAYVEKVIDTLNDLPNVLWIVSEESSSNSLWWNNHQIAHIRSYESQKPHQHSIGYAAPIGVPDTAIYNSDADWVAPAAFLSPVDSCGTGKPACKVNVNDSDHSYYRTIWHDTPQTNRNYAWKNFMNGNQVLFMDPYEVYWPWEGRNRCISPTRGICAQPDPRWNNLRDNLGYILRYSRRLNLVDTAPHPSLSSTGLCLAHVAPTGSEYLVYAPDGGAFTVDLSAMPATRSLSVEWFNPATGKAIAAAKVAAGSSAQTFTPLFSGDAVLYLVDTAARKAAGTH
jgi:Family of unknown function (DUF6298)/Putative collagen-binding domain of a collagenase